MLTDLVRKNLPLLICGAAASRASAARGAYYAGPGNRFWITLHEVGLVPRLLRPEEFTELPHWGIGLTDIVKGQAGNDDEIDFARAGRERLAELVAENTPRILCFNGKRAASEFLGRRVREYGLQPEGLGETLVFVVPSTSAAARRWWDVSWWIELARIVQER